MTTFAAPVVMRYRLELILAFPLIAFVMAVYLGLAFKPESAVVNRFFSGGGVSMRGFNSRRLSPMSISNPDAEQPSDRVVPIGGNSILETTEIWTFTREEDGPWKLSAIQAA